MIDTGDFDRATKAFANRGFTRTAGDETGRILRKSANIVRKHVRAELKPHRRTGRTASNVRTKVQGRGLRTEATVKAGGPVAHLIAGGTAAHEIVPISASALALHAGGRRGQVIGFSAVVHHPGTRADPFFHRGVEKSTPEINRAIKAAAKAMVASLVKEIR